MGFKEDLKAHFEEIRDENRFTDSWFKKAVSLNHNLKLPSKAESIADNIFNELMKGHRSYKIDQKRLDFEVLCANLLNFKLRRPISLSLNRNHWVKSRYHRASHFIPNQLLDILCRNDLIDVRKGYGSKEKGKAHRTKIWPTNKMLSIFSCIEKDDIIFDPVELVELRERGSNKKLDYRDTKETIRIRKLLKRVNNLTSNAEVQYVDPRTEWKEKIETRLYCVFNEDFKHGGRFYTRDEHGYQGLTRDERPFIRINDEPTIELDFSGMFPRLLYARERIQYDRDPYSAGLEDPELRPIIKFLFLCVLNTESESKAVQASNNFLRKNHTYYEILKGQGLSIKYDLIHALKKSHKRISKYFFSEIGLEIMNKDAKIAGDILEQFANDKIPILAIHDSFIVARQYEQKLNKVMRAAYNKHTGGFECPIKKAFYL